MIFVAKFCYDVEQHLQSEGRDECQPKFIQEVVVTVLLYISHSPIMVCTLKKKASTFTFFLFFILTVVADEAVLFARVIDQLAIKESSDDECVKAQGYNFLTCMLLFTILPMSIINVFTTRKLLYLLIDARRLTLDNSLIKIPFEARSFPSTPLCAICLDYFSPREKVTPLHCSVKHTFHTICIKQWLSARLICPLCNYDIELREQRTFQRQLHFHLLKQRELDELLERNYRLTWQSEP